MNDLIELQRQTLAQHLRKHIQGEVRCDLASRHLYSTDASIYQIEPLGVVIPRSIDDLVTAVQVAGEMASRSPHAAAAPAYRDSPSAPALSSIAVNI